MVACESLKKLALDNVKFEVILAEGRAPSRQRNLAASSAYGDFLYFLDDDSLISSANFKLCVDGFSNATIAVVGGPSLTPETDSCLQKSFGYALSSEFGSGVVCKRYKKSGVPRITSDKELILCNLVVRRDVFIALHGFNESLYPNEENEFLERVQGAGYQLLHDPALHVFRSQRASLGAFVRQMFTYGRGRAEQSLLSGSYSLVSFIPLIFVVYLLATLVYIKYPIVLAPLILYVVLAIVCTVRELDKSGYKWYLIGLLGIYPLMHVVNGIGLIAGLLGGKPHPVVDDHIVINKVKKFDGDF